MILKGLRPAIGFGLAFLGTTLTPPPDRGPAEWAEQERIISKLESKRAGPWSNDRFPAAVEIMDACSFDDPSVIISIRGSAQSIKTEISKNVIGWMINDHPRGILIVLPSKDELTKYERLKLDPMLRETPSLRKRVYSGHTETRKSGTVQLKNFRNGFIQLTPAGSSKGFQMLTVGLIVCEEITEYPPDTGGRGFAVDQAKERGTQFEDELKLLIPATPGSVGSCKQTEYFEAGTQGWLFWKCPHCADHFRLRFSHLARTDNRAVAFAPCCGAQIEHEQKTNLNKRYPDDLSRGATFLHVFPSDHSDNAFPWAKDEDGREIPDVVRAEDFWTAKNRNLEGRDKSFHIWRGQSPFSSWAYVLKAFDEAKDDPAKMKVFYQQTLAEPYDEAVDVPPAAKLHAIAGGAPSKKHDPVIRGRVPSWAGFITAAVDLQHDRFEWAVYAWGPRLRAACIDHGVIRESPQNPNGWVELRNVLSREYHSDHLRPQRPRRIGIDTGGGGNTTQMAYQFIIHNHGFMGLKGRPGKFDRYAPLVEVRGQAGRVKGPGGKTLQRIPLTQINTQLVKKSIYYGFRNALESAETDRLVPGFNLFFHDGVDLEFCKQATGEVWKTDPFGQKEEWEQIYRNEQLDLGVYNYALAVFCNYENYSAEDWEHIFRTEAIDPATVNIGPLEALMLPGSDPANPLTVERHAAHKPDTSLLDRLAAINNKHRNS